MLLLGLPLMLMAQRPTVRNPQNNYITSMAQTEDGFLWTGNRKGLSRYSGQSFLNFYHTDSLSLGSDDITSLCADSGNRLWVGTNSGIELIENNQVVKRDGSFKNYVKSITNLDEGHLLVSDFFGLTIYDKEKNSNIRQIENANYKIAHQLEHLPSGLTLLLRENEDRLYLLDGQFHAQDSVCTAPGCYISNFSSIDNTVFLATNSGLLSYGLSDGHFQKQVLPLALQAYEREKILFVQTHGNRICLGVARHGFLLYEDGKIHSLGQFRSLTATISVLGLMTRNGSLWISANHGNPERISLGSVDKTINLHILSDDDRIFSFVEEEGGNLFIDTRSRVLFLNGQTKEVKDITPQRFQPNDHQYTPYDKKSHTLWLTNRNGCVEAYRWNGKELEFQHTFQTEPFVCSWLGGSGELLALAKNKLLTFKADGTLTTKEMRHELNIGYPYTSRFSGKTYLTNYTDIFTIDQEKHLIKLQTNSQNKSCIQADRDGNLWFGTYGEGVFCFSPSGELLDHLTVKEGLSDNEVNGLEIDQDGNLWVSSRTDVLFLNPKTREMAHYENPNRMNDVFMTPMAGIAKDRTIYFGGYKFLTQMNRADLSKDYEPVLLLDEILVNGMPHSLLTETEKSFRYNENYLTFNFTGLSIDEDQPVAFRYRLEGFDRDWIESGTIQQAIYSNLPPGSYRFQVCVQRQDGKWSETLIDCPIHIQTAPWWSWWAILIYCLLVALAVWGGISFYIRHKINQNKLRMADTEKKLTKHLHQSQIDFFSNLSHELRTPLSLIYGPAKELVKDGQLSTANQRLAGLIERNAERMLTLTDEILLFNKVNTDENQSIRLKVRQADVNRMLQAVVEIFAYQAEQKHIDLQNIAKPLEDRAYLDQSCVEHILSNLLSNAIKYTPEGGTVQIEAYELQSTHASQLYNLPLGASYSGNYVEFVVKDTGQGIPEEKARKIFKRFERLQQKGGLEADGYGVGLNYVLGLTYRHGGDIKVLKNHPKGSIFSFVIPKDRQAYADADVLDVRTSESNKKSSDYELDVSGSTQHENTLLIVEDNPDMQSYLRSLFAGEYNILTASDGEEGWQTIRLEVPDIILSDVMMPGKDGYELCRDMKESEAYCHLPIVLLTAKTDIQEQIEGLQLGADAYVPKPFNPEYLQTVVRNLIENRKRLQKLLADRTAVPEEVEEVGSLNVRDRAFLDKLYSLMESNIKDENFNITALAQELAMSRSSFYSKLKNLLGQTPQSFLTDFRLNRAMELLRKHELNISEVCYEVGFGTLSGFSRSFKNKFGLPPSGV